MWPFRSKNAAAPEKTPEAIAIDPSLPLASILIRSMDRPTLQRALKSAARQTWGNVEIVVVAACGRRHKPLPEQILGRPVRLVFPQPDRRLLRPDAANLALESARGEWLNFLDDDDELLPEHLATLLRAPRPAKERVVYSTARVDDAKGRPVSKVGAPVGPVQLYFHSRAVPCALAFHRSLVEEGVRFDAEFPVHEDHDFQIACAARTGFAFVDAVTCVWNAQIGDSGCGFGANEDPELRVDATMRLRRKWQPVLERWLRKPDALMFAGQFYLRTGDLPPARECLERALALRPADGNALFLCGVANFQIGALERAQMLLVKAQRRLPRHTGVRDNLAMVRAQMREQP